MRRRDFLGLNLTSPALRSNSQCGLATAAIADCSCLWSSDFLRALGEGQITTFDESLEPLDAVRWFDNLLVGEPTQVLGFTRYRTLIAAQSMAAFRDYVLVFKGVHHSKPNGVITHSVSGSARHCALLADLIVENSADWSYVLGKTLPAFKDTQQQRLSRLLETESVEPCVSGQVRYSWVLVPTAS